MSQLLIHISHLLVGFMILFGPVIVLLLILNARDRRESTLRGIVFEQLRSPDIRGLFTLRIRHALFLGSSVVIVNLWDCSKEQIWDTTTRLSISLPSEVRLIISGTMDPEHKVGFALKIKREVAWNGGRATITI
jgi:hypothetical protein